MKKNIDLHIHTTYSDGQLNIFDAIELAKSNDVSTIAITDHDTIMYLNQIDKIAKLYDIEIIPGIEISVGKPCNMHILGYGIKNLEKVENHLRNVKLRNLKICKDVIKLLQKDGYEISIEEVYEYMEKRQQENIKEMNRIKEKCEKIGITPPNFEQTHDILDKRCIAKVLVEKGYAKNNKDVYDSIIGRECKNYIPINKISSSEAVQLIHDAGGVAVLAHPYLIVENESNLRNLIGNLKLQGLDGIEILNAGCYDKQQTISLIKLAEESNLLKTVGTDFHGVIYENDSIGIKAEDTILKDLKDEIQKKNNEYEEKEKEVYER